MKNIVLKSSLIIAIVIALVAPALAHHSFAMYDVQQTKMYAGKLTRYIPGANHAQLLFELVDDEGKPIVQNGKPVLWGVETGSAASLSRQGITVESFPV